MMKAPHNWIQQGLMFASVLAIACILLPLAAEEPADAVLQGTILDPAGEPAVAFKAILLDIVTAKEFKSEPTNALGEYEIHVNSGTRYRILAVESPTGERLPVLSHAPIPVRVPGSYRLPDVTFIRADDEDTPLDSTDTVPSSDDPLVAAKPWYKRPGAIVGWVVGGLAVVALASDGGGDDDPPPVSPFVSTPE